MFRYLIRRLLWAVVLFVAVTIVSFVIFFIVPVEPARLLAGPQAPPDAVERAKKQYHLDDPIWKQYGRFMKTLIFEGSYASVQALGAGGPARRSPDIVAAMLESSISHE